MAELRPSVRDHSVKWGLPIEALLGEEGMELHYVAEKFVYDPEKSFSLREKFLPHAEAIEEYWGSTQWDRTALRVVDRSYNELREKSRYFPIDPFFSEFTFDELVKYTFADCVQSEVSEMLRRTTLRGDNFETTPPEPIEFVYKLKNSMWHYGSYPNHWNWFVDAYYAVPQFQFGDGFEIRFDHSRYFNTWGRAQHIEDQIRAIRPGYDAESSRYFYDNTLWLDGIFAYLINYKGKHVLTISFSVGTGKVFLNQVQLRESHGNRWLYKLPTDIFNYSVERFYEHFTKWGFDVYLVDGLELAQKIKRNHEGGVPDSVMDRIIRFYSQPLHRLSRVREYGRQGLKFYLLKHL